MRTVLRRGLLPLLIVVFALSQDVALGQGSLNNGANHAGSIQVGGLDTWTIQSAFNDSITVSLGEMLGSGPDPGFYPRLRLRGPDGTSLGDASGENAAEISARAPLAGVYTVLVANNCPNCQAGPGNYTLTVGKTPGPFTVSSGDEGGPMTNGANHTGVIGVGDLDPWTFQAAFNDSITVSLGEMLGSGPDPGFYPRLRLRGPDGTSLGDASGENAAEINARAPLAGVYTVLVANNCPNCQADPGNYTLTVGKTPGPYTVSSGDEGGPMTNGANHTGVIGVGDLDPWTFEVAFNDSITVSLGEMLGSGPDPGFYPRLRLRSPDGASLGDASGENAAEISVRAPLAGVYTVLVANNCPNCQVGPGNYTLTVGKTPGPYTVSPGDEGGPMTNGANHKGVIGVGDLDPWTFQAAFNDSITVSLGEMLGSGPDPGFYPRLRLRGPDGSSLGDASGENAAEISVRAPLAGVYTVLVANNCPNCQAGPGNYTLTVGKTPGPYTVSSGDEGGPMTNGANHTGVIGVGDLDPWMFEAAFNDSITVSIGEVFGSVPDPGFYPRLRLRGPDGTSFGDASGENAAEISARAPLAGVYTVLVANNCPNCQIGPGNYTLTMGKTPGPYTVSPGDEGGPMTNGAKHTGVIGVGDLDPWTFQAALNDSINLSLGEVLGSGPDPGFYPRLRLRGPDGASLGDASGQSAAEISVRAPIAGTYTVLVANNCPNCQIGPGSYSLKVSGLTAVLSSPVANFTWSPSFAVERQDLQFTDTSTGGAVSWSWTFGDGGTSTIQNPPHIFSAPGTYNVRLTATNTVGSHSVTKAVSVALITQTQPERGNLLEVFWPWPDPAAKAVVITHGWGDSAGGWVKEMAEKLCGKLRASVIASTVNAGTLTKMCQASNTDVFILDWQTEAATLTPWGAYANASDTGENVAYLLKRENYSHIHLIAHSAGAQLIDSATISLKESRPAPGIHDTFLDAFHPFSNPSRYGKLADWADNYVDRRDVADLLLGLDGTKLFLQNGYNIDVTPNTPIFSIDPCLSAFSPNLKNVYRCRHNRPYRFYGLSIDSSFSGDAPSAAYDAILPNGTGGMGYPLTAENGYLMSILSKDYPKGAKCVMNGAVCQSEALSTSVWFFLPQAADTVVNEVTGTVDFVLGVSATLFDVLKLGFAALMPNSWTGTPLSPSATPTESPSWISVQVTTTQPVNTMRVNWRFGSTGEGFLRVFVDGILVREIDQRHVSLTSLTTEEIYIGGDSGTLAPGIHRIAFRLDGFGASASEVELTGVELGLTASRSSRTRAVRR